MDKVSFYCAVCNKNARFMCQRCMETYCSKYCQKIHWPMHRTKCFAMPDLVPVENVALSLYDSHVSSVKAKEICCISYHPEDGPNEKQKRPQKHVPFVNRKGRYILQSRPRKTSTSSSECTELNSTEKDFSFSKTYRHWEKKELQIDIDDVKTNLPVKKSIEFSFDDVIEVVVQHFIESPTLACWVISQEDIEKSDQILKQINMHRSFEAIEDDKIKINHKYCVLFEGVYHRGVVIYRINSLEVLVHLIDNGRTLRTKTNALSQLKNVPANLDGLAIQIKFETMCSIAINELLRIRIVSIDSDGMMNVCCVEEEKIFTQNDITSTPLPENLPVELFCLGYTNIDKGYISVCQNDREKIKFIDDISNQISDYCNQTNDGQGYTPKLNELCLAYFDEEGGWYRAKCVKEILSNTFDLLMIDYGPVFPVKSKNIRKMTKEFIVQPLIMHRCVINGIPSRPGRNTIEQIISFFNRKPVFWATRSRISGDMYTIHLPDLLQAIE